MSETTIQLIKSSLMYILMMGSFALLGLSVYSPEEEKHARQQ